MVRLILVLKPGLRVHATDVSRRIGRALGFALHLLFREVLGWWFKAVGERGKPTHYQRGREKD